MEEGFLLFGDFKGSDGAGAVVEDDFSEVVEGVDAGDVLDFFAEELYGVFVRIDVDVDAFCGLDFFATRLGAFVFIEIAAVVAVAGAVVVIAIVVSAWFEFTRFAGFASGRAFLRFVFRARPCGAEGEA